MEVKAEYVIKIEDFPKLLSTLLKENIVDKIISAKTKVNRKTKEEDRFTVSPEVIEKAEDVEGFPLTNFITYGFARTDSAAKYLHTSVNGAKKERVGLIARPCDTRALIELAKIRQVNLDNLFIIAIEDRGMVLNVGRSLRKVKDIDPTKITKEKIGDKGLIFQFEDGSTKEVEILPSDNCLRCVKKTPVIGDLGVSDIGLPIESDEVILKVYSDKGNELVEKAGIEQKPIPKDVKSNHEKKMEEILSKAQEKRAKDIQEWRELSEEEKIERLQKCTMCGMCIKSCKVCYCVDCILQKKRKEKKIDNISYQLTRVAHVADRCVECGNCYNNCPMNLPLSLYFSSLNEKFKEKFDYCPG
ncbi:MAG: hypothetical protein GF383_00865, partial [Candidatus Lokiarchaeota archaeon]|nr:hypothetical protein [Candidatus Lokiarchaeota archaeon]MBD3337736.1 hypothetical protein [Candidatus Lokiarchaeota archaeon]